MANLTTRYMGLELRNPVIAGASNLVTDIENLKRIEKAGAAAIVYKSLFEEQLQLESLELHERLTEYEERNAEMRTLFPGTGTGRDYPAEYLFKLRKAREAVSIPVFASLNAVTSEAWVEYAAKIEKTGVDGIELNFYTVPEKFDGDFENIENQQIKTLQQIRSAIKIPIAVKLSPFYSNPLKFIKDLDNAGADGFVLFNRLFQPDIDVEAEQHHFPYNLSNPEDKRLPLRFSGLLYGNVKGSVCASSGIFSGYDVIKMILAGADCVQVVSTLYLNQIEVISSILEEIERWMNSKGYDTTESFRGKLSHKKSENKLPYRRAQYIDYMMTTMEIMSRYKTII